MALMTTPAWPMVAPDPQPPGLLHFDALHCTADGRVRVATVNGGARFFVSVDGDNFAGPLKTFEAARAFGVSVAGGAS